MLNLKHVFIINPKAGNGSAENTVKTLIGNRAGCEMYTSSDVSDTISFIRNRCAKEPLETVCFIACGGDGTVNSVANGVLQAENAAMSVLPLGSGNDYVKAYGGKVRENKRETLISGSCGLKTSTQRLPHAAV